MNIEKALVIDDSKVAHLTLRKMLMERNIEVDWVGSGEDGLEYLKKQTPDIVFMDVMMPGMDGFETTGAITSDSSMKAPPIVMCSANATDEDQENARKNGAIDFLSKPYTPQDLDQILDRIQKLSTAVPAVTPTPSTVVPAPAATIDMAAINRLVEETAGRAAQAVAEKTARGIATDIAAEVARKAVQNAGQVAAKSNEDVGGIAEKAARRVAEQVARQVGEQMLTEVPRDSGTPDMEHIRKELTRGLEAQVTLDVQDTLERSMAAEEFRQQIAQIVQESSMPMVKSSAEEAATKVAQRFASEMAEEAARSSGTERSDDGGLKRANIALAIGFIALILAAVGVVPSLLQ